MIYQPLLILLFLVFSAFAIRTPVCHKYVLHLIDANVTASNCSHKITLAGGTCNITTPYLMESTPGYVCFNVSSAPCRKSLDPWRFSGYTYTNCSGKIETKVIRPVVGVKIGHEFHVYNADNSVRANAVLTQYMKHYKIRTCNPSPPAAIKILVPKKNREPAEEYY